MEGLESQVLARLPLAEAALLMLRWVADESFLEGVYQHHRGRCYEKSLGFPAMVRLVSDALLAHDGSGRRALEQAGDAGELSVSAAAFYGKLRRMPIPVSEAFVTQCTKRLSVLMPEPDAERLPASLAGHEVIVIDGKTIKDLPKRLKPLRGAAGGAVGGKTIVALSLNSGVATSMRAHSDGQSNEVILLPALASQTREVVEGSRVWVGDRAYSYPESLNTLAGEADHFVVRLRGDITFVPGKKKAAGRDAENRPYAEAWGRLGGPHSSSQCDVRRITLDRGEQEPIVLVTNLLDAARYPAADLLALYQSRWQIEQVFQQVTKVFNLRHLIGSSPEGSVFQFGFCLLLYNILQAIRSIVARFADRKVDSVSSEKLLIDVRRELGAWSLLVDPEATIKLWPKPLTAAQAIKRLAKLLKGVWKKRWIKSPKKKKAPPRKPSGVSKSVSAYKLIQAAKR